MEGEAQRRAENQRLRDREGKKRKIKTSFIAPQAQGERGRRRGALPLGGAPRGVVCMCEGVTRWAGSSSGKRVLIWRRRVRVHVCTRV